MSSNEKPTYILNKTFIIEICFLHSSSSLYLHTLDSIYPQLFHILQAKMLKLPQIGTSTLAANVGKCFVNLVNLANYSLAMMHPSGSKLQLMHTCSFEKLRVIGLINKNPSSTPLILKNK